MQEKLGLSFKNTNELNEIIDKELPGRPRFQRHELLVGDEVCEVFFRDVIACIRALFADPDFAPYLVFRPEKHYVDEEKTERMFHDMHTGKWWWCTQVSTSTQPYMDPFASTYLVLIEDHRCRKTRCHHCTGDNFDQ